MFEIGPIAHPHLVQLADMFRLLGDPSRLRLVTVLCDRALPATEAAKAAGMSPQLASHHLRLLRAARLLRAERRGRRIVYGIADSHVHHMLADMVAHVAEPHPEEKD
ncbi:ArsR/SmtB family transcription factor [Ferrovibrio sp.]|uniref:ArsR/SmtB family transcription factor n=1 Tax=Ferrovibrio sp. TaxID=1917215 RepID=UPI003517D7AD